MKALASFAPGGVALVIGASGAVGGALMEQLRNDPGFALAVGFSRAGSARLELTSEASIAEGARQISLLRAAPRLIIDATGYLHGDGTMPEKSWRELDAAQLAKAFAINAIGPALLMKHLLLQAIDRVLPSDSGGFFDYRGERLPW